MGVILEKESGCGHVYIVRDAYLCGLGCIINEWVKKLLQGPWGIQGELRSASNPVLSGCPKSTALQGEIKAVHCHP
jgi:hypothetical protein